MKFKLQGSAGVITSLPCPRLKWLVLEGISADLRPGSQLLQDLCAATALEHLQLGGLQYQELQGESDLVAALETLPDLQYIYLQGLATSTDCNMFVSSNQE